MQKHLRDHMDDPEIGLTGRMTLTRKVDVADAFHNFGDSFCESRTQHGFKHLGSHAQDF